MYSMRIMIAVLLAAAALGTAACEQKGPAERAGEEVDTAAGEAADAVATAGSTAKDAVDR